MADSSLSTHERRAPTLRLSRSITRSALLIAGRATSRCSPTSADVVTRRLFSLAEPARAAFAKQAELMRQGVVFDSDAGGMVYNFTRLNAVKPAMIAAATKNARDGAEQFAKDSGASVGDIRSATQGYFSIIPRDGDSSGATASASPFQKVRVVTTVDFYLR